VNAGVPAARPPDHNEHMRAALGVVSLLIALAIVGLLIRSQMRVADNAAVAPVGAAASGTVRDQARALENKVANDVAKATDKASETRDAALEK
jgi:hypothetical protein